MPNGCLRTFRTRWYPKINTIVVVRRHVVKIDLVAETEVLQTRADGFTGHDHVIPRDPVGKPIGLVLSELDAHEA